MVGTVMYLIHTYIFITFFVLRKTEVGKKIFFYTETNYQKKYFVSKICGVKNIFGFILYFLLLSLI